MGIVAIVNIAVVPNTHGNAIEEHYPAQAFNGQDAREELPFGVLNSWKIAAKNGLEYAFSLIDTYWTVHIYNLEGRAFIDTNATVVGYTMLRAFLEQVGHTLEEQHMEKLEQFVMSSWPKPYKELIPDFFTLTFAEYQHD